MTRRFFFTISALMTLVAVPILSQPQDTASMAATPKISVPASAYDRSISRDEKRLRAANFAGRTARCIRSCANKLGQKRLRPRVVACRHRERRLDQADQRETLELRREMVAGRKVDRVPLRRQPVLSGLKKDDKVNPT